MWSKNGSPVSASDAPCAVERQLDADVGLLRGAGDRADRGIRHASTSSSAARNRSSSSVVPAVTRRARRHDLASVADQDAAVEQPARPPAARPAAGTARSSRRTGRPRRRRSPPSARTIRSRWSGSRRGRGRLVRVMERASPAAWVERAQVVRQPHPLQVLHDLGRRQHVPDPRAGERERLGERPHHRDVRVIGDERQRASRRRTPRTPRPRSRARPSRRERARRPRAAARCRSGCSASRRTRRRAPARRPARSRRRRSRTGRIERRSTTPSA